MSLICPEKKQFLFSCWKDITVRSSPYFLMKSLSPATMPQEVLSWSHVDSPVEDDSQLAESSISLLSHSSSGFSLSSDTSPCPVRGERAEHSNFADEPRAGRRRLSQRLPPLISSASGLRRSVSASEALFSDDSSRPDSPVTRLGLPAARLLAKSTYDLEQRFNVLTICMQPPKAQSHLDGPEESPTASTFAGDISGEDLKPLKSRGTATPQSLKGARVHRRVQRSVTSPDFHRHSIGARPSSAFKKSKSTGDDGLQDLATRLPRINGSGTVSVNRFVRKSHSTSTSPIHSTESSPANSPCLELKNTERLRNLRRSVSPKFSPLASPVFEDAPMGLGMPPKVKKAFSSASSDVRGRLSSSASTHLCVPSASERQQLGSKRSSSCPSSPNIAASSRNHLTSSASLEPHMMSSYEGSDSDLAVLV